MTAPHTRKDGDDVDQLAKGIEQTRSEMTATLGALEHQLGAEARAQVEHIEARVKLLAREGLDEAKAALDRELQMARDAVQEQLHEAKDLVTHGLAEARETLKRDLHTAIEHTKQSIRDATLGRAEDLATQAGDAMNDTRDTLVETVRQNPIPAVLVGVGIGWLLMSRSTASRRRMNGGGPAHVNGGPSHDVAAAVSHAAHDATQAVRGAVGHGYEAASQLAHQAQAATGKMMHDAGDTAGQLVHRVEDAAGAMATTARDRAMRAERDVESTFRSNPVALGAAALLAGAAVGYALPRTRKEDELLEGVRDRVLHGATDLAHGMTESLHHLAEEASEGGGTGKKSLSAPAR